MWEFEYSIGSSADDKAILPVQQLEFIPKSADVGIHHKLQLITTSPGIAWEMRCGTYPTKKNRKDDLWFRITILENFWQRHL